MVFFASIGFLTHDTYKKATRGHCYMDIATKASPKNKISRLQNNQKIFQFEEALRYSGSQRKAEKLTGIPRTTYQHLNQRQKRGDLDKITSEFFRQPEGLAFLHQLTVAAEFVITQLCGSGIGVVKKFYELTQLDTLVACSFGTLHERISTLENNLVTFGAQQFETLGAAMSAKTVTCALDETFPSGICLVGIEVESNFILLEQFADKRDCKTWDQAMNGRLAALPIEVIQVVSDEARALVKYTRDCLSAHHSPDVFHVQQEIIKATTPPLRARIKSASTALNQANNSLQTWMGAKVAYDQCPSKPVGRPINYDRHIDDASETQAIAIGGVLDAVTRREDVQEANRGIGKDYHPFNLETGEKRDPEQLREKLNHHFSVIEKHAEQAALSQNSSDRIQKARRMVDSMVLTLHFFWSWVSSQINKFDMSDEMAEVFEAYVLPMSYLEQRIPKAKDAELKQQHRDLHQKLAKKLECNPVWQSKTESEKESLQSLAKKCALVFQRSSSCVEGRNGQLSLKHHASRKMSPRKLAASTVIHNYFITRANGTTAAERLFEREPDNLFEWLVENTDYPALPAKKRLNAQRLSRAA